MKRSAVVEQHVTEESAIVTTDTQAWNVNVRTFVHPTAKRRENERQQVSPNFKFILKNFR